MNVSKLKEMAEAYEDALECDICEDGEYSGLRPDEIAQRIVDEILT